MKNPPPAALLEPIDFIKIIDKLLSAQNQSSVETFNAFLHSDIFPVLGPVTAEIYYQQNNGQQYYPRPCLGQTSDRVRHLVPQELSIAKELRDYFHTHQRHEFFTAEKCNLQLPGLCAHAAEALFPLFIDDDLVALLYVGCRNVQTFPPDYLLGLRTLSSVISRQLEKIHATSPRKQTLSIKATDSDQLQQALFDISEQAHLANSDQELYKSLHAIVGRLLNARNFLIALRQERNNEEYIKFVYYCDEFDHYLQGKEFKIDEREKRSMSGYLLQSGEPVLLCPTTFEDFCLQHNLQPIGTKAYSLVGAPFYCPHLAGVVIVQSYYQTIYSQGDKNLLIYVARHIGDALSRTKTLNDMRETNEIFSHFLNYSPVHVYVKEVTAEHSRIVRASKNYGEMFGKSPTALIGKSMEELFPPAFAAKTLKDDWQVVSSATPLRTEDYLDGRTYSTIKFPILLGEKSLLAGYSIDITELKKHEKEQQKIEKLESLGLLAGGIAHDFNNILTGILGNISFLQILIAENHQAQKPLAAAEKAARRAGELAQQLLTFAKGGEPNKKILSLQTLVQEALSLSLRGSNVRPLVALPDSLHALEADAGQLSQVLNNLIINGIQAMPGGGTLTITAANQLLADDNVLGLEAGNFIVLQIHDEGCGIQPENLAKIFDPYFSTKTSGTGLGLATSYSIIIRHNGRIRVDSVINRGTTFTIYLPSLGTSTGNVAIPGPYQPLIHAGGTILVMDDEKMIRDIASALLSHLGYTVTTCTGGEEAILLYQAALQGGTPYRAVIMDLTIPGGLGGKEAAERLLALAPDAYLIVSSGYSNDPIMANYRQYGFSDAIAKPYSISEFEKILSDLPPAAPAHKYP